MDLTVPIQGGHFWATYSLGVRGLMDSKKEQMPLYIRPPKLNSPYKIHIMIICMLVGVFNFGLHPVEGKGRNINAYQGELIQDLTTSLHKLRSQNPSPSTP